jgi:CBS domain-containing protein
MAGQSMPFRQLVSGVRRRSAVVRRHHDDLVELSELRNAIVHDSLDPAEVIAEPNTAAMTLMERLADLLEAPPRLIPLFSRKVVTVRDTDKLRHALELMIVNQYSRLPVYNRGGQLMALLTERHVARWYAEAVVAGRSADPDASVAAVLAAPTQRPRDNFAILPADATLFDAEEQFVGQHELEAIVITATGARHERPLGIVTVGDLARQPTAQE